MSNLLGVIKAVIGQVYVVEADGSQRLLKEGDRIYSGEEIVTGASGAVSVALPDGKTLDLGRNSHWSEHGLNAVSTAEHATQDVASLQKEIADGVDPTKTLEATAAGNEAPVQIEGGGGHTLVQLDLTGQIVDPTAGFNTAGIGKPTWESHLPESGLSAGGEAPVLPPQVTIDDFAGNDGYINKNEINHTNISGTSNENHVTLVFTDSQKNTITLDVPVNKGHWTAQPDLSSLAEGGVTVVATATDVSGRTAHSTAEAGIDVTGPQDQITIDSVTPDNVINIAESHEKQTLIHGNVSGDAKVGDKVTLMVDGKEYTDVVIDLGNGHLGYQINVSTQGLLADPNIHATVTSTDVAGNTTEASTDHHVDIDLDIHNSVTIETVAGDDIVNRNESRMPTMITGVAGGDAQAGDPVTVTVHGQNFQGAVVVDENGQLRYEVPVPTNLLNEGPNDVQVQLTSHDTAGNEAIATEYHTVILDTQAHNGLTINTVAGDNIVNAGESRHENLISGHVSGKDAQAGDRVVVSVHGKDFVGVVVNENGHLTYNVPVPVGTLREGGNDVQVMVISLDNVGNEATAVEHKNVILDTHADATITVNDVTKDNTLNHTELGADKRLISGEVGGDARIGDKVSLEIDGRHFGGHVIDLGNGKLGYQIAVDSRVFGDNKTILNQDVVIKATVYSHDGAGNEVAEPTEHVVHVDNHAYNGLTISTVAGDNIVNAGESQHDTLITGQVSGKDARVGDTVDVKIGGHHISGTVVGDAGGHLHYEVKVPTGSLRKGNNDVMVTITSHDVAGNEAIAVEHKNVILDTHANATITINDITKDNTLNHTELDAPKRLISGEVGGDARIGDKVSLEIDGRHFGGHVIDLGNGKLGYQIAVDSSVFGDNKTILNHDVVIKATVYSHDGAGNEVAEPTEHTVHVDNHAYNGLTINTVAGDNIVNAGESLHDTLITGQVSGKDARVGDTVDVKIGGHHISGTVVADADGHLHYEVKVPAGSLRKGNNDVTVTITSHDNVGNEAIAVEHRNLTLDTHANTTITVNDVTKDNTLNHTELGADKRLIIGEVGGDARIGDKVSLEIDGRQFGGHVIDLGNGKLGYQIAVDSSVFGDNKTILNQDVVIKATVYSHDNAGNDATNTTEHTVHVDNHAHNGLTINTVAGDNIVNAGESQHDTLITGQVSGKDARVGDTVDVKIGGYHISGTVVADADGHLHYEVKVPAGSLRKGNNDVTVTITSHDVAGNEAIAVEHKNVTLDTHAHASITVNDVTKDNTLNHTELGTEKRLISGDVGGDARIGDKVTLEIDGRHFGGHVIDLGNGKLGYQIAVDSSVFGDNKTILNQDVVIKATVSAQDNAGNEVTTTTEHTVHVDNHAYNGLTIGTVAHGDAVNHDASLRTTYITGSVSGKDAKVGDHVVVHVQGKDFQSDVYADSEGHLHYRVEVPVNTFQEGDNDVLVTVTSFDPAHNKAVSFEHKNVTLDTHADATISVDSVTKDNTLNHDELNASKQWVHGTVGGDARVGDVVDIEINGKHFYGNVTYIGPNQLGYKIPVDPKAFSDNQGNVDKDVIINATVKAHDAAGNEVDQLTPHTVHIDNHAGATITLDKVTNDNVLNHDELNAKQTTITGEVSGDARLHDVVILDINGKTYSGEVTTLSNGHLGYAIPVDTSVISGNQGEIDGRVKVHATIKSHDAAGNEVITVTAHSVHIDNHANATISIDDVTTDNVLNHAELDQSQQIVTGKVDGDARLHDKVEIVINGKHFTGEVSDIGGGQLGFRIPVDSSAFSDNKGNILTDITFTANVTSHDEAHNEVVATSNHTVHIDNFASNHLNISTVAHGDVVNQIASQRSTYIIGSVRGEDAKVGDHVVVHVQGKDFLSDVYADPEGRLHYRVEVPVNTLHEGNNDVQVTVTSFDAAQNKAVSVEHKNVTLDTHADATISVDSVTRDNILNHDELDASKQWVHGTVGGDARFGDVVDIEINGKHFYGNVSYIGPNQLGYSIPVDPKAFSDNQGNVDKNVTINATVKAHDAAGNEVDQLTPHTVHIDNHAVAGITMYKVTGDDTINHAESRQHLTKIAGTVTGADIHVGDKVVVTVNNHSYETTVVKLPHSNALGYSVDVITKDLLADTHPTAHIVGHDAAGNEYPVVATGDLHIDLHADVTISIDPVTGDNMVNAIESKNDFTMVTGVVGGPDVKEGDIVHLHVNGLDLTGPANWDSTAGKFVFNIKVSTHDLMVDPHLTATVSVTDVANNVATAEFKQDVIIDTKVDATITIDKVTDDNTLNDEELNHHYTLVSGIVTGEMHPGDALTLTINNKVYYGNVLDLGGGKMGYEISVETSDIHSDPNIHANISVTDAAQNHADATWDRHVNIDDHADATVTINIVSGDDILNAVDQKSDETTITGRVSGEVKQGDFVDVTVDGVVHHVPVEPQSFLGGELGYSVNVKTSALLHDPHIIATVSITDDAGNIVTAGATHDVARDDGAIATITVDSVTDDNVINNVEAHTDHTAITGDVTGDVHVGDVVDLNVNGQHYYGQVSDNGHGLGYSIDVSTNDLISTDKPMIHASVQGYDAAGNTFTATYDQPVGVDTRAAAGIDIHSLGLNSSRDFWLIEGSVTGDAKPGDKVTITVEGKEFYTTVLKFPDGHLGYNADHLTDAAGNTAYIDPRSITNDTDVVVQITSTDQYGNHQTATAHTNPDHSNGGTHTGNPTQSPPPDAHITISPVAGNDVINKTESQAGKTVIRGTVSGDVHPGDHVTLHIGNQNIDVEIKERPNLPGEMGYEIAVDTQNLINNPLITADVQAHNDAGKQVFHASKTLSVDTDANVTIHLDPIAHHGIINIEDAKTGSTTLSGTVSGDGLHVGSNVTITVNGHDVTTQVFKDAATGELRFSKDVSIDDLRQDPKVTVSVSGHDDQGNVDTKTDATTVTVDTHIAATVSIDNFAHHNVLNSDDSKQASITVTGTATGDVQPGDTVTLHVNGVDYPNVTLDKNLHYSVDVAVSDLQKGNEITAHITGHDNAGNTLDADFVNHYSIDTTAEGSISINVVSGDDILSAKDLSSDTTEISGVVGKDAKVGDVVTVTVNHVETLVHVEKLPNMNGELGYSAKVNTADLKADPHVHVSVQGEDGVGNAFEAHFDRDLTVDDHADVVLHFNNVTDDNVLNLAESQKDTTEISGTVTGDVKEGDHVIITVNGNDLTATLHKDATGGFSFKIDVSTSDLLQNPHITYQVTGVDAVGNTLPITESNTVTIDQEASNQIHIDVVAGDDKVNIQESASGTVLITGTVDGDAHANDVVTITVNGHSATGGVVVGPDGRLTYAIPVPTNVLKEGDNSVTVSVTGEDAAHNSASSADTRHFTLDTTITSSIHIDTIAHNNVINAKDAGVISVTGTVDGDAKLGDVVTLHVHGHDIETKVEMINGHLGYEANVHKDWLKEGDNLIKVSVEVSDDAHNTQTAYGKLNVVLDTHADATITLDPVNTGHTVNAAEVKHLSLTGQVDGDAKVGDKVILEVNGHTFTTDVKMIGNHLGYDVGVNKAWLHEGHNDLSVSVSVTDDAGNHFTTPPVTQRIDVDTHADAVITIDKVTGDNHIDALEAHDDITHITGHVTGDVHDGDKITAKVNGHDYHVAVHEDNGQLNYDISVDTSALKVGHNNVNLVVDAYDDHGNVNHQYQSVEIAVEAPKQNLNHANDVADKSHHAASQGHGLSILVDDGHDSLSFELHHAVKGHAAEDSHKVFTGKADSDSGKVDLRDLAHELHEGTDITHYIKGGADGHGKVAAGEAAHTPGVAHPGSAADIPMGHETHSSVSYSLDHLIAKPEHYSH